MRLDPIYDGSDSDIAGGTPDGIQVSGVPAEFDRIGPLPSRDGRMWKGTRQTVRVSQDGSWQMLGGEAYSVDIPPDRSVVDRIAKHVEVECDDKRLIDWMAQR